MIDGVHVRARLFVRHSNAGFMTTGFFTEVSFGACAAAGGLVLSHSLSSSMGVRSLQAVRLPTSTATPRLACTSLTTLFNACAYLLCVCVCACVCVRGVAFEFLFS